MSNPKDPAHCLCTSCNSHPKSIENIFPMHEYSLKSDRYFMPNDIPFSKHISAEVKNKVKQQITYNETSDEDKNFDQHVKRVPNSIDTDVLAHKDLAKTISDVSLIKKTNFKTSSSIANLTNFQGHRFTRRVTKYPRRSNLASRSDVVNKCSIRKLRRHFWTLFRVNNK